MSDDTEGPGDTEWPGDTEFAPQAEEPQADESPAEASTPSPEAVTEGPVTAESAAAPEGRQGILLPTWVAVVLAVLLIGGVGFAIGYWTGDGGDSDERNAASGQPVPNRPGPSEDRPGNNRPNGGARPDGKGNNPDNGNGKNGNGNKGNGNKGNGNKGNGNGPNAEQTAFLGVSVEGADNLGGARVTSVQPGSPATDAGLKTGDVITKVGDTTVQSDADLIRAIRNQETGDEVTITYTRDGNSAQVKVKLGNRSDATRRSVPS